MNNNFFNLGENVGYQVGVDVMLFNDNNGSNDVVVDDGFLHVSQNGFRVSFDIGQDVSNNRFNRLSQRIMNLMNVPSDQQVNGLVS